MGTNNLFLREDGTVIEADHVNDYFTALVGVHVPRNSSGVPTNAFASLGSNTFRWDDLYLGGRADLLGELFMRQGEQIKFEDGFSVLADGVDLRFRNAADTTRLRITPDEIRVPQGTVTRFTESPTAQDSYGIALAANIFSLIGRNGNHLVQQIRSTGQVELQGVWTGSHLRLTGGADFSSGVASLWAAQEVFIRSGGDAAGSQTTVFRITSSQVDSGVIRDDSTGDPANVRINPTTGRMQRSTSSRRYKKDIKPLAKKDADKILELEPVSFKDKGSKSKKKTVGLIAEDVAEVLPDLVEFKDDQPESVSYDRVPAYIIMYLKKQKTHIDSLEARIEALEAK